MAIETCRECGAPVRVVRGFIANHDGAGAIRCVGSRDVSREASARLAEPTEKLWRRFED